MRDWGIDRPRCAQLLNGKSNLSGQKIATDSNMVNKDNYYIHMSSIDAMSIKHNLDTLR